MTDDELDEKVLAAFLRAESDMRSGDIHAVVYPTQRGPHLRNRIEESISRLLSRRLIRDVTASMDFHSHYRALSPLDMLAGVMKKRRRRRR